MPRISALVIVASVLAPAGATAQTDISVMIATDGLAATEARLTALADPTPTDLFALGGVQFLGGVEAALQARWQTSLDSPLLASMGIPLLRLPVSANPAPDPFRPEMIDALFATVADDMAGAVETLSQIDGEVGLRIDLADLWFDVNMNASRDPGEGAIEITGGAVPGLDAAPDMVVRFDTADAAWLRAYAHLLAGISDTIRAIGPTDPIARVMATAQGFADLAGPPVPGRAFGMATYQAELDLIAMIVFALEQTPDPVLSRSAHAHFLAMIADNRRFWSDVARETDDDAEWIPNKNQRAALGLPFPPETGTRWLAVLSDAEKVLTGDLLIPYWRLGPGAGLDVGALFTDPPPLDPIGLIQGETLLPYARTGPLADTDALRQFEALIGGNAGLYMVMLN